MKPAFEIYAEPGDIRLMCTSAISDFRDIAHEADSAAAKNHSIASPLRKRRIGILNFLASAEREFAF